VVYFTIRCVWEEEETFTSFQTIVVRTFQSNVAGQLEEELSLLLWTGCSQFSNN